MSDTVYVLDQVGIRLVKEKTLISDTQLKRPEQVVGFVSDILREYDREAENKGEKHLTTAGYASIISRSVKVDKWKPKPRQPFSIDNDSHLRWNRGL